MLYAMVRPLATIGLKHYFKRIDLANADRIPKNAAVILAANHPTTFIEPCILACLLDVPINFLARGDFFQHPILAKLLGGVHITPVYRIGDGGYEKLKDNFKSFEKSFETLQAHKPLMILAEGRCIHEKRLRPIRKGTARIALGALENTDLEEVYIVPIGVNYTYADRLRSKVMLNCAEPIKASDYLDRFKNSAGQAINELTKDLKTKLANEVIIIENQADEPLVENLLRLQRTEEFNTEKGIRSKDEQQLRAEKKIADWVDQLPESNKNELKLSTHDYFSRLEMMRINDAALMGKYRTSKNKTSQVLLGAFPAFLLLLWHLPPLLLAQWVAGAVVKSIEFSSPVRWGALMLNYLLYFLIWVGIASFWGWWLMVIPVFAMLTASYLIQYFETANEWLLAWRAKRQTPHEVKYVKALRKELIEDLKEVI